jgi:hypothetical protein
MDRNKGKQPISEAGSVSMAGDTGLHGLTENAEGIPVPVLPFQGQQFWVYNQEEDGLKEPVLLSMIRSVRKGDAAALQKWARLRMIVSEYKGIWSGLGIRYTNVQLRAGATDYVIKVVSFGSTSLVLLKTG